MPGLNNVHSSHWLDPMTKRCIECGRYFGRDGSLAERIVRDKPARLG